MKASSKTQNCRCHPGGAPVALQRPRRRIFGTALVVLAVSLSLTGCKKAAPPAPPVPTVQVLDVGTTNVMLTTELIGQLDSPQNVEVRARVEAFVDKWLFTEGGEVKEGDLLFELDKKPFQQRLAAAQGRLAEARAALKKYEADVARLTPLAKARAIPQQDLDNAHASVDVGQASVQSAEAQLQSAQIDLGYCDVKAPVSGLIGAKQVSVGELVGKGTPTLLATISTQDPIWFYCNISEVDYLKSQAIAAKTGRRVRDLPVTLILADGSIHPEKGKFVFIDRAVDTKTGTFRTRIEFPNGAKLLRPGMFARVVVDLGTRPDSILVPERAVAELQGKTFVWVVGSDSKATQRPVQVGPKVTGGLLIMEGLKAGERIVTEGLQKVRDGAPVQPVTAAQVAQVQSAQQAEAKLAKESDTKHGKE